MKKCIIALFLGILIGAAAAGAYALASGLAVVRSPQAVCVNGEPADVEAYNINGSNYFKARDLAAAIDAGIWYDSAQNSVMIDTNLAYIADYSGPAKAGGTNPDIGVSKAVCGADPKNPENTYVAEMTLNAIFDGDAAWLMFSKANPKSKQWEGLQYIVASFTIKVQETGMDAPIDFTPIHFGVMRADGSFYNSVAGGLLPEPGFVGTLNAGDELTGYAVFLVDEDDPAPMAIIGSDGVLRGEQDAGALFLLRP